MSPGKIRIRITFIGIRTTATKIILVLLFYIVKKMMLIWCAGCQTCHVIPVVEGSPVMHHSRRINIGKLRMRSFGGAIIIFIYTVNNYYFCNQDIFSRFVAVSVQCHANYYLF